MSEQTQEQQTARPSMEELVESLTGFEEVGIEEAFGQGIVQLLDSKATMAARALVFVLRRRDGMKAQEARKAVMEMRLGDVQGFFVDEDDHPESPEGKDETPPA